MERSDTRVIDLVPALMKLKNILVPVDFSPSSDKALTYAVCFAEQFGAKVTVLNIVEPAVYPTDLGYVPVEIDSLHQAMQNSARQKLAGTILGGRTYGARPHGHHIWLPLPERWTSRELVANAQSRGLAIVGSDAFVVGTRAPDAVRLALGAASSRLELGSALGLLLSSLDGATPASHIV